MNVPEQRLTFEQLVERTEAFIRDVVIPRERDVPVSVTRDTVVEQVFREIRAFRIYDGPSEVHRWSLAKTLKNEALRATGAHAGQLALDIAAKGESATLQT